MSTNRTPTRALGRAGSAPVTDAIAKDYAAQFPAGGRHPLDRSLITAFAELVTGHGAAPWPTWAAVPAMSPRSWTSWAYRPSASTSPPPW